MDARPAVAAARLRVEAARRTRAGLAAPLPLRLDLQATSNRGLYGNDDDLALSQAIDLFGRRRANRALGDAGIGTAEAALRGTLAEVQGDVVDRFAEATAANALVATARTGLALAERLLDATRRRAEGGIIAPVGVRRVDLEVQRARSTLALREAALDAARRRLAGAIGVPVETVTIGDFDAAEIAPLPVDAQVLARQRPDLLALAAGARTARANVGVSRLGFRPDFEISARTSLYSYGSDRPTGLRATLSLPIFDYGRARNEVRAGEALAGAEDRSLLDAVARAGAELNAVSIELAAAAAARAGFDRLLADSRELVRISEVGFNEGATTLLEVLEANRALREVEENLVEARLRVAQAQAAYLRTTGTLLTETPPQALPGEGGSPSSLIPRTPAPSPRAVSPQGRAAPGYPEPLRLQILPPPSGGGGAAGDGGGVPPIPVHGSPKDEDPTRSPSVRRSPASTSLRGRGEDLRSSALSSIAIPSGVSPS